MAKDGGSGDRRTRRRYPLELDLEFKVIDGGAVVSSGAGKTQNLSSGGVLFRTAKPVNRGLAEISIHWPAVLGGIPFIELHISGHIIRSDGTGAVVRLSHYEFQKAGNPAGAFYYLSGKSLVQ